jgi:hypothetical protein
MGRALELAAVLRTGSESSDPKQVLGTGSASSMPSRRTGSTVVIAGSESRMDAPESKNQKRRCPSPTSSSLFALLFVHSLESTYHRFLRLVKVKLLASEMLNKSQKHKESQQKKRKYQRRGLLVLSEGHPLRLFFGLQLIGPILYFPGL